MKKKRRKSDHEANWHDIIMANGSVQQPFGIIEDVLLRNYKFTFPTNFVIMEMEE